MNYFLEGKFSETIEAFENELSLGTCTPQKEAKIRTNIGAAEFELDLFRKCVKSCQRAIACDPSYLRAHLVLAKAHIRLGKKQDALNICRHIVNISKDESTADIYILREFLKIYDSVYAETDEIGGSTITVSTPQNKTPVTNQDQIKLQENSPDLSRQFFNSIPKEKGELLDNNRGTSAKSRVEFESLYETYILRNPELNPIILRTIRSNLANATGDKKVDELIAIGNLYVNTGKYNLGIEIFNGVIKYQPKCISPYLGIGSALALAGDLSNAIAAFSTAITIDPTVADAWKRRGQTRVAKELLQDAMLDFNRSIELYPDADIYLQRGLLYIKHKNYKRGLEDLRTSLDKGENSSTLYNNIGICEGQQGNVKSSLTAYLSGLKIDKDHRELLINYAQMLKENGDWKASEIGFSRALEVYPNDSQIYNFRGLLFHGLGRHNSAIADFTRALSLPTEPAKAVPDLSILFLLGISNQAIGRFSTAITIYDRILHHNQSHFAFSFRQWAIALLSHLDDDISALELDDLVDAQQKEACSKRLPLTDIGGKKLSVLSSSGKIPRSSSLTSSSVEFSQSPLPTAVRDISLSQEEMGSELRPHYSALTPIVDKVSHFIQLQSPGFLPNIRQHRMFGIAVLQMATAIKQYVLGLRDSQGSGTAMRAFSYKDVMNIIVKWRQVSEPNDSVWWIHKLTKEAFEDGFGLQTPIVNGQLKTIRYYSYFPMAFQMLKDMIIAKQGIYNAAGQFESLSIEQLLKISKSETIHELYATIGKDFYVITPCRSIKTPETVLEGTRLTVVTHEPEGYEFTIRTAGKPDRWDLFDIELQFVFDEYLGLVLEEHPNRENIFKKLLHIFYFWVSFAPLTRGSAACGYGFLLAGLLAADLYITKPVPVGKQLDWESILSPTSEGFVDRVSSWLDIAQSPFSDTDFFDMDVMKINSLRRMIEFLNYNLEP